MLDVYQETESALMCCDPLEKAEHCKRIYNLWLTLDADEQECASQFNSPSQVRVLEAPGRPTAPRLINSRDVPRRKLGTPAGRIALVHSLAHIEFNAINLALDAVFRFRQLPARYIEDWLRVASEEGEHFLLLHARLQSLDANYGDLPAHDGLWDMARRTAHDVLVRMALVPRILEARGLDVAPPMIARLQQMNDEETAVILQRIYTDEITHVEVGNRWFRYLCQQRSLDGTAVFRDLLKGKNSGYLQSPYNTQARLNAGFNHEELELIKEMEAEYKAGMANTAS